MFYSVIARNERDLPVLTDIGSARCDFCQHVWIWCPVMTGSILNFPSYHLSLLEERSTAKTRSRALWTDILIYCYQTKLWGSSRACMSGVVSQHTCTFPSLVLKSCPHVSEAQILPGRIPDCFVVARWWRAGQRRGVTLSARGATFARANSHFCCCLTL